MRKRNLAALALCLLPQLLAGSWLPSLRITFLAPFIVDGYYRHSLTGAIWVSFAAGLVVDLLGGTGRLGLIPLSYCLATLLLYRQRRHLFSDSLSTLPILASLFGLLSSLFHLGLLAPMEALQSASFGWLLTNLIFMPVLDGVYALVGYAAPLYFLTRLWRKRVHVY